MTSGPEADPASAAVVWLAHLSQLRDSLPGLEALLDSRERERAGRFRFPEDRARFVAGRGLLRLGLRRYAPDVPATAELGYSPLGRPLVPEGLEAPQFSIAHTRDVVGLAFAFGARVGIDVEYMQAPVDLLELAERILSEEDFREFQALPNVNRQHTFFHVWTRKEAYLKARGEGITTGLREVSVAFTDEAVTSIKDPRDSSAASWRLHVLPVPKDYMGCLACDEVTRPVVCLNARVEKDDVRLEPCDVS